MKLRESITACLICAFLAAGCGGGDSTDTTAGDNAEVVLGENEYLATVEASLEIAKVGGMVTGELPAKQVMIGTTILEVSQNNSETLGVSYRNFTLKPQNNASPMIEIVFDPSGQPTGIIFKLCPISGNPLGRSYVTLPLMVKSLSTDVQLDGTSGTEVALGSFQAKANSQNPNSLPLVGDIPAIGFLFKGESYRANVRDLVIMISPSVITDNE